MSFPKKIFTVVHVILLLATFTSAQSYKTCCLDFSDENVQCIDRNRPCSSLPIDLKQSVTHLSVKDQPFHNSTLSKHNFSHYAPPHISLRKLYIRNCNVKLLKPNALSALTKLEMIDLSKNENMTIEMDVFNGLKLRSLQIDGVLNLKLDNHSFRGLEVTTLSMKSCGLTDLTFTHLSPLVNSLKSLILTDNKIKTLNSPIGIIFRHLNKLDLTGNTLKCDCKLKWLMEMYKTRLSKSITNKNPLNSNSISDSRLEPICLTPNYVKSLSITKVKNNQLICDSPKITNLNIHFDNITHPRLVCSGYQDAINAPLQISWSSSNGKVITESFINKHSPTKTLVIRPATNFSHYRCVINNTIGSITASVNINWPAFLDITNNPKIPNINKNNISNDKSWYKIFFDRRFTLLEILLAIFGTILLTAVLFVVLHKYLFKHCIEFDNHVDKKKKLKANYSSSNIANVSLTTNCDMNAQQIYSNSQTYDQPGLPYSTSSQSYLPTSSTEIVLPSCNSSITLNAASNTCKNNNCHHNPQQFLDFKTQRKIYRKL